MRKVLWVIIGILFCVFFMCIGGVVFTSYLPKMVQAWLLPEIQHKAEISGLSLSIRKLDLFGIDVSDVAINKDQETGIAIDTVKIDFSPTSLVKKQIRSLSVSGINLFCQYKNGKLTIPGLFPFPQQSTPQSDQPGSETAKNGNLIQFLENQGLEFIRLTNINLFVDYEGHLFQLPMEAEIRMSKNDPGILACEAKFFPYGQAVYLSAHVDLVQGVAAYEANAKDLIVESFAGVLDLVPDMAVTGRGDISANGKLDLSSFQFKPAFMDVVLHKFSLKAKNLLLTRSINGEVNQPVRIQISSKDGRQWQASLSGVTLANTLPAPLSADLENVTAEVSLQENQIGLNGQLGLGFEDMARRFGMKKSGDSRLSYKASFAGSIDRDRKWELRLDSPKPQPSAPETWEFLGSGFKLRSRKPEITFAGKGQGSDAEMDASVYITGVTVQRDGLKATTPGIRIKGRGVLKEGGFHSEMETTISNTSVDMADYTATIPTILIKGSTGDLLKEGIKFTGKLAVSNAAARMPSQKVTISDIALSLPLVWPCENPYKTGELNIGSVGWGKKEVGGMRSSIRQEGMGISVEGSHQNKMISGLIMDFSGKGVYSGREFKADAHVEMKPHTISAPLDLGRFFSAGSGITCTGKLNFAGNFLYDARQTLCEASAKISEGNVFREEQKLAMKGIETSIYFPDLLKFKTEPKQIFEFHAAEIGDIKFQDGHIEFQVESRQSILIEKSRFNWCNGQVATQALRIRTDKEEYDLVLYCDRLNLSKLIAQFGIAEAEGDGTVNGKIPLRYARGRWIFDDGFLYSSPGAGGRIKMLETERWSSAIPKNTPQYGQIQFAQEAVKDYNYDWAKVGFNTKGQDLLMMLSFYGKTTKPLPFKYETKLGQLVPIDANAGGGIDAPIYLDLNFKGPLDEILYYRKFWDMIEF